MSSGGEALLKLVMIILNSPHRLLLTTIPGRGFKCDRTDGQVVCPKCLKAGVIVPMHYDRHLEISHRVGMPGCATDRFVCHVCFYDISARGRVGKTLNRCNPYKIFCFSGLGRMVKLLSITHKRRKLMTDKERNGCAQKAIAEQERSETRRLVACFVYCLPTLIFLIPFCGG